MIAHYSFGTVAAILVTAATADHVRRRKLIPERKPGLPRWHDLPAASSSGASTPEELYYHEAWAALPTAVRDAYATLGYDESIWNEWGVSSTDGLGWDELTGEQRDAASLIGYCAQ